MAKILIVEDDSALCGELSILLENAGYTVEAVTEFRDTYSRRVLRKNH